MTVAEHTVSVAYDRARYRLAEDSRATMLDILAGRSATDDLARWALNHDDAAVLRERWALDLATEAKNATEPIWKNLQGDHVDIDTLWEIFSATDDNGRSWAVSTVLASPVLTDEIRDAVWKRIEDATTSRKADESLRISIENAEMEDACVILITAPWEWLGGWYDQPIDDDGSPIPDGFEVVARFNGWLMVRPSEPPRYLRAFARALWDGRWREQADKLRNTILKTPALIRPVYNEMAVALTVRPSDPRQLTLPGLIPVVSGAADAISRAMHAAGALSPTAAHHLVRWIVRVAACAWDAGQGRKAQIGEGILASRLASGVEVEVFGGFDRLRHAIGLGTSKKTDIKSLMEIFSAHSIPWTMTTREGISPLMTWDNYQARPGVSAYLVIGVSPLLCPGLASERSVPQSDRVLIPCLSPPSLPIGGRSHGALLTLDWLALSDLGNRRAELLAEGGVRLNWRDLADRAKVSREALDRTLLHWLDPEVGRWTMPSPDRYRLADRGEEGHAHRLLIEGATISLQASKAGKLAAAKRASARGRFK